ncbi:MAG TPA: M23 family metallopeptidase [Mycobacteriales bacterium]|nr:M23 family metallopeptidase [Mycobacteriales bacterium]
MSRFWWSVPLLAVVLLTAPAPVAASAGDATGGWTWPLPPPHEVVARFDPPSQRWLPGHRGVDLAGSDGEPVRAAGAGVVAFAGRVAGVGVVSVRHPDGLLTTYEPVRPTVSAGEQVRRGQRIGRLTAAGSHCAPRVCLHWGLRRDATYLDPLALVGRGAVRLLPVYGAAPPPGRWTGPALGGVSVAVTAVLLRRRRLRALWASRPADRRCRPGSPPPPAPPPPPATATAP